MRGDVSKLIFVDSSVNTDGRDHTKLLLPPTPFSAQAGERMALTLVSFSIRRNWYNIHAANNTFYLFVANATYHQVQITPGVYSTFDALATAINDGLVATIASVAEINSSTVTYNATTRFFTISLTMVGAHSATKVEVRSFHVKSGALPAGVSLQGGLSDVHEILGGRPIRDVNETFDSLNGTLAAGVNTLVSKYPAALNTLDAIYLHMNTVETGNFMSTGHESHTEDSLRLIESSLFARIKFDDSTFTEVHEVVSYEDSGNDAYQSILTRKSIDTLDVRVTDHAGRSLATLNPQQAADGMLAWRAVFRWDLFYGPRASVKPLSSKLNYPLTL